MYKLLIAMLFFGTLHTVTAQELIDGVYYDNNLRFFIVEENIKRTGELEICIANEDNMCVENVFVGYTVHVLNQSGEIIWKSIWSGQNMRMKFKQKLPEAHSIHIKARSPHVMNKLSTSKIHQDKPLELRYTLR
jgi:hypothetical protein